jgi:hypothetical protein
VRRYEGVWSNGQRHGFGTLTDAQGNRYRGFWVRATLLRRSGMISHPAVGGQDRDDKHGEGELTLAESVRPIRGLWKAGTLCRTHEDDAEEAVAAKAISASLAWCAHTVV